MMKKLARSHKSLHVLRYALIAGVLVAAAFIGYAIFNGWETKRIIKNAAQTAAAALMDEDVSSPIPQEPVTSEYHFKSHAPDSEAPKAVQDQNQDNMEIDAWGLKVSMPDDESWMAIIKMVATVLVTFFGIRLINFTFERLKTVSV
jgi:hypothetical protein